MSSPRPKSPRTPVLPKKEDKEESFWDKIGTIGRKKRIKEVQDVQAEGKYAIDSPGSPTAPEIPPEEYSLLDNEERAIIEPRSLEDPRVKELIQVLIDWINDELAMQRIIVKDISEDLYDGQVLQKLLEKLTETKLDVPEVTQSEEGQRQKTGIKFFVRTTAQRSEPYDNYRTHTIILCIHTMYDSILLSYADCTIISIMMQNLRIYIISLMR
ncbi:beta-parvin-like [Papilio machaon]|uniref:beta-parvin-like n=1 Tax=Papilio machaon TaxID=76193 RepID=UPI001E664E97|nr:beta-parvin-like [Papilio machaon]